MAIEEGKVGEGKEESSLLNLADIFMASALPHSSDPCGEGLIPFPIPRDPRTPTPPQVLQLMGEPVPLAGEELAPDT